MELKIKQIIVSAENPDIKKEERDSTDVIVLTEDDQVYFASFITFQKIENLRNQIRQDNGLSKSKYLWMSNVVLVAYCTKELITEVVYDIIEEGNFLSIFKIF